MASSPRMPQSSLKKQSFDDEVEKLYKRPDRVTPPSYLESESWKFCLKAAK